MMTVIKGGHHWFLTLGGGFYGFRLGRVYLSLRSPEHRPLFSERNRYGCRVLPLWHGWRFVLDEVRSRTVT